MLEHNELRKGKSHRNTFVVLSLEIFQIIPKIEKKDGSLIIKQFDILDETKKFYEDLYTCKDSTLTYYDFQDLNSDHEHYSFNKLSDKEKCLWKGR